MENIPWEKVLHRYLLTNKVKKKTFKLIHKCYPTKTFLRKYKSDIDVNCRLFLFFILLKKPLFVCFANPLIQKHFGQNLILFNFVSASSLFYFKGIIIIISSSSSIV